MPSPYLMYVPRREFDKRRNSALHAAAVALRIQRGNICARALGHDWERMRIQPELFRKKLGDEACNVDRIDKALLEIKDALDLKISNPKAVKCSPIET